MKTLILLLVLLSFGAAQGNGEVFPNLLKAQTEKHGNVLAFKKCKLGLNGAETYGLLVQSTDSKVLTTNKHPLEVFIAKSSKDGWELIKLPRKIVVSNGSDSDFLSDFWSKKKGYQGPYDIRCTSMDNDPDINIRSKGEFLIKDLKSQRAKHLCFQASIAYNSWSCFTLDGSSDKVVNSFAQLRAD